MVDSGPRGVCAALQAGGIHAAAFSTVVSAPHLSYPLKTLRPRPKIHFTRLPCLTTPPARPMSTRLTPFAPIDPSSAPATPSTAAATALRAHGRASPPPPACFSDPRQARGCPQMAPIANENSLVSSPLATSCGPPLSGIFEIPLGCLAPREWPLACRLNPSASTCSPRCLAPRERPLARRLNPCTATRSPLFHCGTAT